MQRIFPSISRCFVPPEDPEILLRRLRRATPLLLRGFAAVAAKDWELQRLWEDAEGGKQALLGLGMAGSELDSHG